MIKQGQLIKVVISNQGKHYKSLGYIVKQLDVIYVPTNHLMTNSNMIVDCICDDCEIEFKCSYQGYNDQLLKMNKNTCKSCGIMEAARKNSLPDHQKIASDKNKIRSGNNHPRWNPRKSEFKTYLSKVTSITKRNDLTILENFNRRGMAGVDGAYHLDHIFSIKHGFENRISPMIIGNKNNIRMLTWENNYNKRAKSEIEFGTLLSMIESDKYNYQSLTKQEFKSLTGA